MKYPAKIIKLGGSLGITIPKEAVEAMSLKDGDICMFDIEKANYEKRGD